MTKKQEQQIKTLLLDDCDIDCINIGLIEEFLLQDIDNQKYFNNDQFIETIKVLSTNRYDIDVMLHIIEIIEAKINNVFNFDKTITEKYILWYISCQLYFNDILHQQNIDKYRKEINVLYDKYIKDNLYLCYDNNYCLQNFLKLFKKKVEPLKLFDLIKMYLNEEDDIDFNMLYKYYPEYTTNIKGIEMAYKLLKG